MSHNMNHIRVPSGYLISFFCAFDTLSHMGVSQMELPQELDALFMGKSQISKWMINYSYPHDLGNLQK